MIDTVDGQLAKLAQGGLEPEDRRRLERIRGSAALLRSQATELRAYCETPAADKAARKEHQAKFHRAREETWTAIKELLGTKDGPAPP
jgi:SRSO17 transposase